MYQVSTQSSTISGTNGAASETTPYTTTGLKKWSSIDSNLPGVEQVKYIHVYDFDNTLFASPLPNKQIWQGTTIGFLQSQDQFVNGGWWHDASILASTGDGVEKEEPRAWKGWWNEEIVKLVELSMQQKDVLNVLLTGRSKDAFAQLVRRIVKSKGLEFDMICLKPVLSPYDQAFGSTIRYKTTFLADLVSTYKEAEEIRVYEDRVGHVHSFREFFNNFNTALISPTSPAPAQRKSIVAEVIQVSENTTNLNPVTEIAEIQRIINFHNLAVRAGTLTRRRATWQIKRTVFYTGYIIPPETSEKLLTLFNLPPSTPNNELRIFANNILITPRPAPHSILEKVGGIGNKVTWRVVGTATFEHKLWAAKVQPWPKEQKVYSENPTPTVVIALRKNARPVDAGRIQNWQPVPEEKAFIFETVVGEKVSLRIDEERAGEDLYQSFFPTHALNRGNPSEQDTENKAHDDFPPLGASQSSDTGPQRAPQLLPQERSNDRWHQNDRGSSSGHKDSFQGRNRGGQRHLQNDGRGGRGVNRGRGRGRGPRHEPKYFSSGHQGASYKDPDDSRRYQDVQGSEGRGGDLYNDY